MGRRAPRYDIVVKGGRVIDPDQGIDRVLDVAVRSGKISDLGPNIAASDAGEVVDARGLLVFPGLVDIHTHVAESDMGPAFCLTTCVTSLVDAGSRGAGNVTDLVTLAKASPNRVRILLNLSRKGLGQAELLDFETADVAAARRAILANPDIIVGIKARLSRGVAGEHDLDAIRRAREVTAPLKLPLMVHVGQSVSPMPAIVGLLGRGDIVTHMYAPPPNGILDADGRVLPEVLDARKRGIIFDIGNGRSGHIAWDVAERAMAQGFLPDTISSDLTGPGRTDRAFDLPTVLSKFLMLGMPLQSVVACATVNAAGTMAVFKGLGTLRVGRPADIAVYELKSGDFEFVDSANAKRKGSQKLFPRHVIAGGAQLLP